MKLPVIVENENGNWGAHTPEEGVNVFATGSSREEVLSRFKDGLRGLMEYRQETGKDALDVTELEIYEASERVPVIA